MVAPIPPDTSGEWIERRRRAYRLSMWGYAGLTLLVLAAYGWLFWTVC